MNTQTINSMKTLSLLILTLICNVTVIAQPWIGPVAGSIYYNSGNVGIGTSTPTNKLQIGTSPSSWIGNDLVVSNSTANKALAISSDAIRSYVFSSGRLDLYGNNTCTMSLSSDYVGIGTTNPLFKTEIYGSTQLTANLTDVGNRGSILALNANDCNAGSGGSLVFGNIQSIEANSLGWASIKGYLTNGGANTTGDLAFSTRNSSTDISLTERMRILSNGNVGIGTTTPGNKLDVNGTIRAKEVKVESGWADYVFDKGYNLQDLSEVELYINQHKHLPDVPDANEVEKNGVNLGEMNALLLKKIEELTLYAIEQNKKIETLEKTVNNLIAK